MIDAARLLADLKRLRRRLDADLRQAHATGARRAAVEAEWRAAKEAGRTAETFETFFDAALDQAGVHWVLACVFLRFLEDNGLVERPVLGGPGERLDLARERHTAYFRQHPHDSDLDYLLDAFAEAAHLAGLSVLFDPARNPLFRLPVSGDGAIALREFFQAVVPETGAPAHDFTDPDWDTRFLGDLYQDLSEEARKRFALLQTPGFVEAWILDRTLEPAIREFGFRAVRMIDPACGSGHFLLGGFARVLREWERHAPDMPPAGRAQRALEAVAGVDLNPFAMEIARFRLLLAALRAAGVSRLRHAPDLRMNLAAGNSLLHGRHFFLGELGGAAEGLGRTLRHHYVAEDTSELDRILGRQYHAVVGNPPYITPKDAAMRDAYREIYESCHMKYALAAPFIERFFDLAQTGTQNQPAGFVGLIVANSFMKREFGKKLIEVVLPRLDLTYVVDCAGAYIPGHGTPTAILFGRNRAPVGASIRTVMGIKGEPATPADPAQGFVWHAIVTQTDIAGSVGEFVSVADTPRATFARHPWSTGGGGASELKEAIEETRRSLATLHPTIGFASFPGADELFVGQSTTYKRAQFPAEYIREMVAGEKVRDFCIDTSDSAFVPYSRDFELAPLEDFGAGQKMLWCYRSTLAGIVSFGGHTKSWSGEPWWGWYRWVADRYRTPLSITFAEIATHNHFVLDRGGKVFNRTAPVIKLPPNTGEDEYLALLGLLNSSTVCFWMKQVSHQKQMTGGDGVRVSEKAKVPYAFGGTQLKHLPLPHNWEDHPLRNPLTELARRADQISSAVQKNTAMNAITEGLRHKRAISGLWYEIVESRAVARSKLILIQEEIDFICYRMYNLYDSDDLFLKKIDFDIRVDAGERPFCIITQFNQEGFGVPTDVPAQWPTELCDMWRHRMAVIKSVPALRLIEDAHYKRRWIGRQGLFNHDARADEFANALKQWLLDRLEDRHFWPDPTELLTTNELADRVRHDADFTTVAIIYTGREDFGLEALVADLVARESVPFLAALRYAETGLRKRALWEETWRLQRRQDAIDAEVAADRAKFLVRAETHAQGAWRSANPRRRDETPETYVRRMMVGVTRSSIEAEADRLNEAEQKRRKKEEVGDVPVPPKYRPADFLNQDFWRLRGGLDLPKERFVSFPDCSPDSDGSLVVIWAGYDHLARATALGTTYQVRKDQDGWPAERLTPLLAGLQELLPWLIQWHNGYDAAIGGGMGDYFADLVTEEARMLGLTEAALAAWRPPAKPWKARGPRKRTSR